MRQPRRHRLIGTRLIPGSRCRIPNSRDFSFFGPRGGGRRKAAVKPSGRNPRRPTTGATRPGKNEKIKYKRYRGHVIGRFLGPVRSARHAYQRSLEVSRLTVNVETLAFPDTSLHPETAPPPGPIRLGSEGHKNLFCRTLLATFDPYRPAVIDWPRLESDALQRLTSLPIWDIAVHTEAKAGLRVRHFRRTDKRPFTETSHRTQRLRGAPAQARAPQYDSGLWHRD